MRSLSRIVSIAALAAALPACTMIPDYERPPLPVPDAFLGGAGPAGAPAAADLDWREFFADERLQAVVDLALESNRDLRIAALEIERAAALYRVQRSELTPGFGLRATGERFRLPENMTDSGEAEIESQYSVNLGFLSWEIDLFGRLRSLKARALEQFLAVEQGRDSVGTALVAAVAGSYLQLAADAENLRLAEATFAAQQDSLGLIRSSRDAGVASDLELRQAESQVAAARVSREHFVGAVAVDRNALELLLGAPLPDALLPTGLDALAEAKEVAAGIPSEVLLERPDIRAAEHQLRAANANLGAARAAFFPRISLTAAFGTLSSELSGLFASGSRTWTFAPNLDTALYAGGLQFANWRAAKVEHQIAVAQYEKAIQTAFAEVSDALVLRASLRAQREALDGLVAALDATYRLSDARYRAGIDGYLGVLVAQRALYDAQRSQVDLRLAERVSLLSLYKALGGGPRPAVAGAAPPEAAPGAAR